MSHHDSGDAREIVRFAVLAMERGVEVHMITDDQEQVIAAIQRQAPGTLCEVVSDHHLRLHPRKALAGCG